jgi:hypothetical protein
MAVSIVCQVEGWVVRKGPLCDTCYWYVPGSEKVVEKVEPAYDCLSRDQQHNTEPPSSYGEPR